MRRAEFVFGAAALASALGISKDPLAELELRYGGRLGVFAVNARNGAVLSRRPGERFPMCSTFKLLLVGSVLSSVDAGNERFDRHVTYSKADLLTYAPVTRANVGAGYMTVRALCAAAIEYSDNTAANLLLETVGGPKGVTAFARSLGDSVTRLDRNEPSLNDAVPGDVRDTTAPSAMAGDLQKLLTGNALSPGSRGDLKTWLIRSKTGAARIRAGVPAAWVVGNKTGSGDNATSNDVAVLYPPNRAPIFVAAYYTGSTASAAERDGVLAEVGRIVSSAFS